MSEVAKLNFVLSQILEAKKSIIQIQTFRRAMNVKGVEERTETALRKLEDAELYLRQIIKDKMEDKEILEDSLLGGGTTD